MPPGSDLHLQWKINVNDHPRSLQVANIMASINNSLHHLGLVEEAVVSAYQGYACPDQFNGYYGRGSEGFIGHGPHRLGCRHSENGNEEQFSDGNVLHQQYPSEDRGF